MVVLLSLANNKLLSRHAINTQKNSFKMLFTKHHVPLMHSSTLNIYQGNNTDPSAVCVCVCVCVCVNHLLTHI